MHIDQSSDEEDVYEDASHELFTEDQTPAVVNLADNPVLTQANLQLPRAPVCAKKSVATVPRSSSSTNGNGRPTAATTVNGNKRYILKKYIQIHAKLS